MRTITMFITVEQAMEWLKKNTCNRPIRQNWVRELARRITAGEWRLTHQGIAFDEKGMLIDGQHRLLAICKAGKGVECMVTFGFELYDRAMDFPVDTGIIRRPCDVLEIPRPHAEVISFIAKVYRGGIQSNASLRQFMDVFYTVVHGLHDRCGSARRGKTAASIRTAACIHAARPDVDCQVIYERTEREKA